ncbi:MAG: TldD/PmbA family protein [Chloroflexi bacterium]|nr:TldD/PmbA family protein [Chloroflexota bacterium]
MPTKVGLEFVDRAREIAKDIVTGDAAKLPGMRECDVRVEIGVGKGAVSENGNVKRAGEDYGFSLGVHALAGNGTLASGYAGKQLGTADTDRFHAVVREAIETAHARAVASASAKRRVQGRFGALGKSIASLEWAPVRIDQKTIPATYHIDPQSVSLAKVQEATLEASRLVSGLESSIVYNVVGASTSVIRELFVGSEGIDIDNTYAQTEAIVFVVARGPSGNLEFYDSLGHQRGWEILESGVRSGPIQDPGLLDFARQLGNDATQTAAAPPMKTTDGPVTVVVDPHFAALVAHEIIGHPSELDRALKYETAYAGRSWFLKRPGEDMRGKQVGSPKLTAFSDPTIEGFGHYLYDHEGTPAKRAYHIRNGVYEEFVNNRQTAALFGVEPNGSCRATDATFVPLIRMSNTTIAPGSDDPARIMKEVDHGYYISGHRIPSIAESRENFRISAMKVYEIRNGELGQLYRDGGVMADTKDFFMSIDAVGTDWRLYAVPNCGKGQPMQAKRMSNGGPTIRGRAVVTGASA